MPMPVTTGESTVNPVSHALFERAEQVLPGGVNSADVGGQPNQATFRGPAEQGAQYISGGVWGEDQLTIGGKVTFNLGLRYDRMHAASPDEPTVDNALNAVSPRTRALVLSMHANPAYVVEAIQSGAAGYVLKGSSAAELVRAIRAVADGSRHLSPPLSEEMVEAYAQRAVPTGLDLYRTLTQREREVLHLAAEGQTSAQIGARLNISPRTVEVHRANLLRKLRLRGQSDLVRYAVGRGILTVDG